MNLVLISTLLAAGAIQGDLPSVPFELVKDQILLSVRIGEQGPYTMLLDTGVTPSALDLEVARETGLLQGSEPIGEAGGAGSGRAPIYQATLAGLVLGSLSPPPFEAVAIDMTLLGERLGRPLHGILGHSFLAGRRVRIDYPRRKLEFPDRDAAATERRTVAYSAPLVFVEGDIIPLLGDFRVNGTEVPVSLDTGSSLVLELYPEGAARAEVAADPGLTETITGVRGDEEVSKGRVEEIALGPLKMRDAEITLSSARRGGYGRQGNLGNGFLKRYVLTLDYEEARIVIEKPAGAANRTGASRSTGHD